MSINTEQDFIRWEGASRDTIDLKRIYIDLFDDLASGVWMSQLIYYFLPVKDDNGSFRRNYRLVEFDGFWWLPINREAWWHECRVKIKQYDRIVNTCEKKGLIITRNTLYKNKKTPHIRINWPVFLERINDETNKYHVEIANFSKSEDRGDEGGKLDKAESSLSVGPPVSIGPKGSNRSGRNGSTSEVESEQPFELKRPEHKDKEVLLEALEEQHHQAQAPLSDDDDISIEKNKPALPVQTTLTPLQKPSRRGKFAAAFDALDDEAKQLVEALVSHEIARGTAIELVTEAPTLAAVRSEINWFPGHVQDVIDGGKTVENKPGLLIWAIRNLAPEPKSLKRAVQARESAADAAARVQAETDHKAESIRLWNELTDAQKGALAKDVFAELGERYPGQFFNDSSTSFRILRDQQLRNPETRAWLSGIKEKKARSHRAAKSETAAIPTAERKRMEQLSQWALDLVNDIEDGLLKTNDVTAWLIENTDCTPDERRMIVKTVDQQRAAKRKAA